MAVVARVASNNGGGGSGSAASLSVTAPDQYPSGNATTAYLTITNTSNVSVNNVLYAVSEINSTGAVISIDSDSAASCVNLAATNSCVLKVNIGANSHPGSFAVTATSAAQDRATFVGKMKSLVGLDSNVSVLTTHIGLTTMPANQQSGANGISFLYSPTISPDSNGTSQLSVVAVVNSNVASNFNTINLTTSSGSLLDFSVLSGNSGNGSTNLTPGSIVTFTLKIPAGSSSPYTFYAQTMENGSLVDQGSSPNSINIGSATQGVLVVQPTGFNLSASENYLTQVITYTNTGNGTISGLSISTPATPVSIAANDCQTTLEVGRSCLVVVTLGATGGIGGSGSLVATYSGGNSVKSEYNYSGSSPTPQPGVSLSAINNFSFAANTSNGSNSTQVTILNSGNTNESNFVFSFNPNQYFSISHGVADSCLVSNSTVTSTLIAGESCTLTMVYNNSVVGVGLTDLTVNYNYDGASSASISKTLAYQTTQAGASLSVAPSANNFGMIVANNSESKTQTFTITNAGSDSATGITFQNMSGDGGFFSVESGGTGGCATALPLANGATCTFKVKFGPSSTVQDQVSATLPIAYSFAGGSSSTSVNLSGYSRATLAANVELYSVIASGTSAGNGESVNTAYLIESSAAAGSTITLRYKNIGLTAASNFTITNAPTGYMVDNSSTCGAGNTITLQANGVNNCTVILKPSVSTAGSLNVTFSGSSLSGNWTDEQGSVSNQAILWNTDNGTQNTLYVNIFASAQVVAVMSNDSAGTVPITQVRTGATFYIVLSLTGGYNVNTSYTVTAPAGFSPLSSSCNITSSNPQCSVAITAPATSSTGNVITISGGSPTPTPASFTFDVVVPTTYAYIATGATGLFQCDVSAVNGALSNCIKKAYPTTAPNYIVSLALDPTGTYLYTLTNLGSLPTDAGSYYACNLGSTGQYESTNCGQKNFPSYGNIAFAPTQGTMYAYVAGQTTGSGGNQPNYCNITQESSLFCNVRSSYPTQYSRTLSSMVINNDSYVYISSIQNSKIYACDVTNTAGYTGSNCPSASGSTAIKTATISNIPIGTDSYAYIVSQSGGAELQYCKINTTGVNKGSFENDTCIAADPGGLILSTLSTSTEIATINLDGQPYLYAYGDNAGQVSICSIRTTTVTIGPDTYSKGELSECTDTYLPGSITTTVGSMAFGNF